MAVRRKLGNLAQFLLQDYMQRKRMEEQSELVKQRQLEMARYEDQLRQKTAQDQRNQRDRELALSDPTGRIAESIGQPEIAPPLASRAAPILEGLGKVDSMSKLPSFEETFGQLRGLTEGDLSSSKNFPTFVNTLKARENVEGRIKAQRPTEGVEEFDPATGQKNKKFVYQDELEGKSFQQTPSTEQAVGIANQTEKGTRGEKARTAGTIAGAEAAARLREELRPEVLAAKLKFEQDKAIAELATVGKRVDAEDVAKRGAAVKGLMPTYQQYRQLAVDVLAQVNNTETRASMMQALSKVPWVGEFLGSATEWGHALDASLQEKFGAVPPGLGRKIAELNKLTDTLAQGMANAVLGNRGQTTENDRRTAKNILVNSFVSAKQGADMLAITDKMFGIAPAVANEMQSVNPNVTASEILVEIEKRVRAGEGATPEAPTTPTRYKMTPGGQMVPATGGGQ